MRLNFRDSVIAGSLLAMLMGATEAQATTIALQPGAAGKDTQIVNGLNAATNYGTSTYVIDNWSSNLRGIALIEFDLSAIPTGATINSATLSLYQIFNTESAAVTFDAFRVTSAWNETTVTFNTAPTFDATAVSSLTFTGAPNVFRNWSVTGVVQGWVSGTFANNGLWIEEIPVQGGAVSYFGSSDSSTASQHPILTIDFTPAQTATVPEPSTLILFATGAAFVVLRRSRRS